MILISLKQSRDRIGNQVFSIHCDHQQPAEITLIFPQSDISSIQSTFQPGTEQIFSPLSCQILLQAYRRNGLLDRLFIQRLHQIILHFQLYRLLGILKFIEAGHDIITGIRRYFLPQFYGFQSGRPRHLNIYICHGDLMFFQHF